MFSKSSFSNSKTLLAALFVALILVGPAAAASREMESPAKTVNGVSATHKQPHVSSRLFFHDWTQQASAYVRKFLSRLPQEWKTFTAEPVRHIDLHKQERVSLNLNEMVSIAEPLLVPGVPSTFFAVAAIGEYARQHGYWLPSGTDSVGFPQLKHFATQLEESLEALQSHRSLNWKTFRDVLAVPPPSPEKTPVLSAAQSALWDAKLALLQQRLPEARLDISQAKQYLTIYEFLIPEALRQIAFELTPATYISKRNVTGEVGTKPTHSQERSARTMERLASRPGWWSDLNARFKKPL